MSSIPPPQQPGQPNSANPQQPAPSGQQQAQGLPPTGLQQQLASLNSFYGGVQNAQMQTQMGAKGIGFNVRKSQFGAAQGQEDQGSLGQDMQVGSTSLDSMARNLAQRYGMPIGRGRLVDEHGNFLMTPQQIADASGGSVTLGEAAAQMNYISQAVTRQQNEQQQKKGMAALQEGLGQVQSRGRGSMAAMMSGYYQDIADLYSNQQYEAADFSFYIQKEQLDIQKDLQRRAEKMARNQARGQFVAGVAITAASLATGNVAGAVAGGGMVAGSAGSTGWF